MFNEDGVKICGRYTISYDGYLFYGDNETGFNSFDLDRWDEVSSLMAAYPDLINVTDNEYGVSWSRGEWY